MFLHWPVFFWCVMWKNFAVFFTIFLCFKDRFFFFFKSQTCEPKTKPCILEPRKYSCKTKQCVVFTFQLFTDGITNKLIGCYVGDTTDDVVLVRIYGNKTELLVDRDEEVKSFRVLQAHGCAPQLYCTFNNGLCYEFMQGEALDPEHVCNPDIFR